MEEKITSEKLPSSSIVLFDSSSKIEDLKKILNKKPRIISFDYESHEILEKNNITHEISDHFVSRDELVNVQNSCYNFAKWFEYDAIKKLIDYEGINLGLLIQVELNYFLVQFVKKFVEITKIFNQNRQAHFIASPALFDSIKLHTSVTKLNSNIISQDFYYDVVKIPVNIKGHNFTIRFSKDRFNKLKKIFEITLKLLLGSPKIEKTKKTILAIEFDTIRYKKIFENIPNTQLNLIVFNRRRPAIWNTETFSIIKNSGCSIITSYSLMDKTLKYRVKECLSASNSKIQSLWELDNFFESFFSINGISFWQILRPLFKELFTKRAFEVIPEIEMTKRLFEKYHFDSILVWLEIGSTEQIVVKLAKRFGIKIILLQHGLFYDSDSQGAYNMNKFQGVYPIDADKYVVWGKIEEKHQIKRGTQHEKLTVLGSPLYDDIFNIVQENDLKNFVLLATSGPVKENAIDLTVETIQKNRQTIRKICEVVTKMNKKLVIKLHPSQDEFNPVEMVKEISPNITVQNTGDIAKLIKACDIFVTIDASTVILDAHMLKKPVISVLVKDSDYGTPSVLTDSCILTNMDDFEKTLQKVFTDENFRKTMIEKGTAYTNEYLVNQSNASIELLRFLSDYD